MNKYIITGSIGHISKPVVEGLIKAGKNVTVITSNSNKVKEIEALGAKALAGSVQDETFLKKAFQGADVVYTMIPPIWQTDNWRKSQNEIASNYIAAIKANNIKYVVNLSSVGAHLSSDVGPVTGLHDFEQLLNKVEGLNVKHLRPAFFYYNLLNQVALVKQAGILGANYGETPIALVHTRDIAAAALDELLALNFKGNSARYIVSDARSGKEVAQVLGKSISKEIPWVVFTDEQQREGLLQAGLPETIVNGYVEMGASVRSGKMLEDVFSSRPAFSATKLEDFAKEFSAAFNA